MRSPRLTGGFAAGIYAGSDQTGAAETEQAKNCGRPRRISNRDSQGILSEGSDEAIDDRLGFWT